MFAEQDPVSTDGKNRWQEGIDAWTAGQSDAKLKVPKETYEGDDKITVIIKEPSDRSQVNNNSVTVSAEGTSVGTITKMEIYIDGDKKKESNEKSISDNFSLSNGIHSIRVKATDDRGNATEWEIAIGVNQPYGTPTPLPTNTPTNTPSPTLTP